jgi:hypothetical protein
VRRRRALERQLRMSYAPTVPIGPVVRLYRADAAGVRDEVLLHEYRNSVRGTSLYGYNAPGQVLAALDGLAGALTVDEPRPTAPTEGSAAAEERK